MHGVLAAALMPRLDAWAFLLDSFRLGSCLSPTLIRHNDAGQRLFQMKEAGDLATWVGAAAAARHTQNV